MYPELSLFLARVLGLYLLIAGIAIGLRPARFQSVIAEATHNSAYLVLSGALALIVGLLLVLSHNVWVFDFRIIITVMGWMALLKGVGLWLFPEAFVSLTTGFSKKGALYGWSVVLVVLGLILVLYGFLA